MSAGTMRKPNVRPPAEVEAMVDRHRWLIPWFVGRHPAGRLGPAEVGSAAAAGLLRAAELYDPGMGCKFSHYAEIRMRSAVQDEQRHLGREWEPDAAFRTWAVDPSPGPGAAPEADDSARVLHAAIGRLPAMARTALALRYRLDGSGGDPRTFREVGELMGCTRQAVDYHIKRALAALRSDPALCDLA